MGYESLGAYIALSGPTHITATLVDRQGEKEITNPDILNKKPLITINPITLFSSIK
ncbi:F8 [Felid gammaherpesvirus 1]|uniref:F8 n=1 Tax=Felid gammaherpesvirus 1 TaxID=2560468 RepID=A0A0M5L623_9GAMA|nr:F8 [Felis catus gammaherpesvirus 1]ALE14714.1 F8 [Felis catus gammaherpesvirus 1]